MEQELAETNTEAPHFKSNVDTSRPFRSVKEAVAIFGERFLAGELYSASPKSHGYVSLQGSPGKLSPNIMKTKEPTVFEILKKLESDLEETKIELQLLKKRASDTEIALASLNAELHKNMMNLAKAEVGPAGRAVEERRSGGYGGGGGGMRSEEERKKMKMRMEDSPTLAQILSIGEKGGYFGGKRAKKTAKKKPIIPLIGDIISMVKRSKLSSSSPVCN